MNTIISHPELKFLNYNNSYTIHKKLNILDSKTYELVLQKNIDFNICENFICFYWKLYNLNEKIQAMKLSFNDYQFSIFREPNYYSLVQPFQHLPYNLNDDIEEKNYIYMLSQCFHPTEIFKKSGYTANSINTIKLEIQLEEDIKNKDVDIEFVIQHLINPNNLP
jgi:hypothetical protein